MKLRYKNKSYFPLPRRDNNNKNKKHKLPLGRSQSLIINSEHTTSNSQVNNNINHCEYLHAGTKHEIYPTYPMCYA